MTCARAGTSFGLKPLHETEVTCLDQGRPQLHGGQRQQVIKRGVVLAEEQMFRAKG